MTRDQLIADNLDLVERVARKLGQRPDGLRWDDIVSDGNLALIRCTAVFDRSLSPEGEQGFRPFAAQRIKWAMLDALERPANRVMVSLDRAFGEYPGDGESPTLLATLPDRMADSPILLAQASDLEHHLMENKSSGTSINKARERAPAVQDLGEWARSLKAAAYGSVGAQNIQNIMARLVAKAEQGSLPEAKFVLSFLCDPPPKEGK